MVSKKKPAAKAKKASPVKKVAAKKPAAKKAVAKKPVAKKAVAKKPVAKKPATKKVTAKKPAVKKAPAKKPAVAKKLAVKKAPAKKAAVAKKTATKKPAAKKPVSKKPAASSKVKSASTGAPLELGEFTPYMVKRGEQYMNEAQRNHFKKILLTWRNELMEEVDRTVHHLQDEATNPPDPADRATLEEEFSIELRTRDRERRLIKKIDSTIELIAKDDYGFCDSCGVEIGIRRLEARPTANKCIDCKTLDEIKERQLGA
jgi:DnaK suppressor protein